MKIGVLGGTFNPIHFGHLHIAEEVLQCCRLDQIWFMPTCHPPHKQLDEEVSFADRLAMVATAVVENPHFFVSDLEGQRGGTSYSVETLLQLHREFPEHQFYFIMGLDSFQDISSWKDYEKLFALAHLVVTARPGFSGSLSEFLPVAIADRFCYDAESGNLRHKDGFSVFSVTNTCRDVSSTEVRQKLIDGCDVDAFIPQEVNEYIRQHRLYQKD